MASSNRKFSNHDYDAVGYSKHMEVDEDATLGKLQRMRSYFKRPLKKHNGSIFNTGGLSFNRVL